MSEPINCLELIADGSSDEENSKSPEYLDAQSGAYGNINPSNPNQLISEYTVDEAITWIGTGCFQFKLILITGLLWSTDAMEMMIITILQPIIIEIWDLNEISAGSIAICVYGGMLIGTYILGTLSDRIGRRLIIIISVIGYSLFSLLCAFSINYYMLLIMRFILGIFIGGGAVGFTLFAEFCPTDKRGRMLVIQQAFWSFGAIYAALIGWLCMEYLNWRYFLMFTSIPLWTVSLFCFWIPESPHYLMAIDKYDKSKRVLQRIADSNNSYMPNGCLVTKINLNKKRGRLKDVFSKQYGCTSIALYIMLITSVFSYFGLSFIGERIFINDNSDEYKDNLVTVLGEIPALLIGFIVIDKIGRITTLRACFIIYSIICLLLCFSAIRNITTFGVTLLFIGRVFASLAYMTQFIYFTEYYPTLIRATAIGAASSLDEISKICADYFSQDVQNVSLAMIIFACFGIISLILAFTLKIETLGTQLNDKHNYSSKMHLNGTMRVYKLTEKL